MAKVEVVNKTRTVHTCSKFGCGVEIPVGSKCYVIKAFRNTQYRCVEHIPHEYELESNEHYASALESVFDMNTALGPVIALLGSSDIDKDTIKEIAALLSDISETVKDGVQNASDELESQVDELTDTFPNHASLYDLEEKRDMLTEAADSFDTIAEEIVDFCSNVADDIESWDNINVLDAVNSLNVFVNSLQEAGSTI